MNINEMNMALIKCHSLRDKLKQEYNPEPFRINYELLSSLQSYRAIHGAPNEIVESIMNLFPRTLTRTVYPK